MTQDFDEQSVKETEKSQLSEKKPRQPDTWWSWVVCAFGATSVLIVLGCGYCFGILLSPLLDEFKKGKSITAWVGSVAVAACGLFGPLSGRLTDQFGARVVVICGSLLCSTGLLLTSVVPNLYLMFLTYGGIFGIGSSFVYIALFEIVPRYFMKHRSLATGLMAVSTGAGIVLISPICHVLLTAYGWRGAFMGLGSIASIVFFLGWVLDSNVASEETGEYLEEDEECESQGKRGMLDFSMWRNSSFVIIVTFSSFIHIGHCVPPIHFARYCQEVGIAKDLTVWLYSCIGLLSLLARVPGAKLCDAIGSRRVYIIFVVVSASSSILLPFATDWIGVLCFAIFYGLADGLMAIGAILSCLQSLIQKQKAQGFGFFQLVTSIALLTGPPIGGLIADNTSSYQAAFFSAGIVEFLGVIVLVACLHLKRNASSLEKGEMEANSWLLIDPLVVEKETVV